LNQLYEDGEYWRKNETYHEEDAEFKAANCCDLLASAGVAKASMSVVDVGCGSGGFIQGLAARMEGEFLGIDVSPQAVERARQIRTMTNATFETLNVQDLEGRYDLVTSNDVFEHVDDYIGFLRHIRTKGDRFYFNIPLDMTVLSVLRGAYLKSREQLGHLHYFSKGSALATLEHAGYDVVAWAYNSTVLHKLRTKRTLKSALAAGPRLALGALNADFAVNLFGGASLGVVCR